MTRPILPPRYVNGSLAVLLACKDERAAWYTYSVLKAFAWSEDTLVIDRATMKVLKNLFGIPKQTLYRHLNWLASSPIHAVLRYGSAGGHTQVDFSPSDDVAWDSPIDGTITVPNMRFAYSSSSVKESINLNQSLKEEEGSPINETVPKMRQNNRLPDTPAQAVHDPDIAVFSAACGRIPGSRDYATVIDTIRLLRERKGLDDSALAQALKPYWLAWSSRKRTDGRPYDPANLTWFSEWALNETIPPAAGQWIPVQEDQNDVIRSIVNGR